MKTETEYQKEKNRKPYPVNIKWTKNQKKKILTSNTDLKNDQNRQTDQPNVLLQCANYQGTTNMHDLPISSSSWTLSFPPGPCATVESIFRP